MYIKVKVIAGSKKEKTIKNSPDRFEIWVKEPAERNLANTRVLEIVRVKFPGKNVQIINGHHSPSKLLVIDD